LQLYYNLSYTDLAAGALVYPMTGETFRSLHKLTSEDFLHVAGVAKYVLRFDKMVEWTEAALQVTTYTPTCIAVNQLCILKEKNALYIVNF
jgi:hypothetical protein